MMSDETQFETTLERRGYVEGLNFGIRVTQQADCCCRCQDDISDELKRIQTLDTGVLGNIAPLTTREAWDLQNLQAAEQRGYKRAMLEAAHIAEVDAVIGRGSRSTARALAVRYKKEAAK
jgi:hypothetical protein